MAAQAPDLTDHNGLQAELSTRLTDLLASTAGGGMANPGGKSVPAIINTYALLNAGISAGLNLVPGPWGMLVAIPEIAAVMRNQMAALAKRDGTFHILEKMYVKQVGRLLGFSETDMEEAMAAVP